MRRLNIDPRAVLPELPDKFTTGERVVVEFRGEPALGKVGLASPNGRSLFIEFDGVDVGIPVTQEDDGSYVMLLGGFPVTLRRMQ